jgi:hypothetical protein
MNRIDRIIGCSAGLPPGDAADRKVGATILSILSIPVK